MKRIYPKQLTLALSAASATVLAAAVLLWGAAYKCSLYHGQHQKHPRIAIAKLLSERERPAAVEGARRAPLPEAAFFATGSPLFGHRRHSGFERIDRGAWREAGAAGRIRCMIHFFFRPPPALAA